MITEEDFKKLAMTIDKIVLLNDFSSIKEIEIEDSHGKETGLFDEYTYEIKLRLLYTPTKEFKEEMIRRLEEVENKIKESIAEIEKEKHLYV